MLEVDYFKEDLPGNKRHKSSRSESVQLGYASDSEDPDHSDLEESEGSLKSEKEEEKDGASDGDMFASDEEVVPENKKSKILDMDKFEQEQGLGKYDEDNAAATTGHEDVADPQDEQELIDYYNNIENFDGEDIIRPKQELAMEAFNLREEAEEGEFDKNMNYVRKKNSDDEDDEDAWMANIKKSDIENAKQAQLRQVNKVSNKDPVSTESLLAAILDILEPAETPMEALARLRPSRARKKRKVNIATSPEDLARKQTVFRLTESCERLLDDKGVSQIYDMTKEELLRAFKRETGEDYHGNDRKRALEEDEDKNTNDEGQPHPQPEVLWEYRWLDEDNAWNGPHTSYEITYWKENYFENNVEVRKVGDPHIQHISEFPDDIDYST